jgi:hypothetical protein
VEIQQPDPLPASAATATSDILGAAIQLSIEDTARTMAFLRDAIGFAARPSGQMTTNPVVVNLINLPGAQRRITHGSIPATTADFGLIEYSGVAREKFSLGAADPGSPGSRWWYLISMPLWSSGERRAEPFSLPEGNPSSAPTEQEMFSCAM